MEPEGESETGEKQIYEEESPVESSNRLRVDWRHPVAGSRRMVDGGAGRGSGREVASGKGGARAWTPGNCGEFFVAEAKTTMPGSDFRADFRRDAVAGTVGNACGRADKSCTQTLSIRIIEYASVAAVADLGGPRWLLADVG